MIDSIVEGRKVLALAVAMAGLWVVLAIARPGVTYHLAPLIVAGVPPAMLAVESSRSPRFMAAVAVAGTALALAMTLALSAFGRLSGPSLLPFGGAAAEAVLFSAAGGVLGLLLGVAIDRR